jgi:hypothetical protein
MKCSKCENGKVVGIVVTESTQGGIPVRLEFRCKEHMKKVKK